MFNALTKKDQDKTLKNIKDSNKILKFNVKKKLKYKKITFNLFLREKGYEINLFYIITQSKFIMYNKFIDFYKIIFKSCKCRFIFESCKIILHYQYIIIEF